MRKRARSCHEKHGRDSSTNSSVGWQPEDRGHDRHSNAGSASPNEPDQETDQKRHCRQFGDSEQELRVFRTYAHRMCDSVGAPRTTWRVSIEPYPPGVP
jgi:hypothetical protein